MATSNTYEKGFSRIAIIGIVAIILLMTGIGFYYFSRGLNTNQTAANPTPTSAQNAIVDTSDWTVYANKTYGYTLSFPATYEVPPQTEKEISQLGLDNNIGVQKKSEPSGSSVIVIDVYPNKDSLSLNDYMNKNMAMYGITGPLVNTTFNGYDCIFNRNQPGTNVFVNHGNYIYHITASAASSDKEIGDIVATFKFTQ